METHTIPEMHVTVKGEVFENFAKLTRDTNPIHTDLNFAVQSGFEDTPVQGALLHAFFESYSKQSLNPNGYFLKFKEPAYPGDILRFKGTKKFGENFARLTCGIEERVLVECGVSLGDFQPYEPNKGNQIRSFNYRIFERHVGAFYEMIGRKGESLPAALASSLIPASLLKISSEEDGRPKGIYRCVDLKIHGEFKPGNFRVDISIKREPKRKKGVWIYDFGSVCYQKGEPVLSGDARVVSEANLNI